MPLEAQVFLNVPFCFSSLSAVCWLYFFTPTHVTICRCFPWTFSTWNASMHPTLPNIILEIFKWVSDSAWKMLILQEATFWLKGYLVPILLKKNLTLSNTILYTLQGTNISPKNGILKMIFLFPRWDMLIPWRVFVYHLVALQSWGNKNIMTLLVSKFSTLFSRHGWLPPVLIYVLGAREKGLGYIDERWCLLIQQVQPRTFRPRLVNSKFKRSLSN